MNNTIGSWIGNVYNKIEKRYKVCFYAAIICGLMAHIYALTNHLYNYDELWHTPTGFGTGTEVGRWALSITVWIQKVLFDDCFTIPFINGFITIVLYSLAACFVVAVFSIDDEFYAGVTGALMTTFPALTCRMFYMFTTHYYAIGIAMVALGVWVLVKKKHNVINTVISIALVVYGTAIYQANFVTAVCMLVGFLLIRFVRFDGNENVAVGGMAKDTGEKQYAKSSEMLLSVRNCANYVIFLGVCMASFLIGSKFALAITGKQMETYENLDTMGQLSVNQLITGLVTCYKTFLKIPIKDVYSMNPNSIVKLTFLICLLVLAYTLIRVWRMEKEVYIKVLATLIIAVMPIAINLIAIMAIASGTMYSIMVYEIVFMIIIPIGCLEALREVEECNSCRIRKYVNAVMAIAVTATIATYIWFANGNYLAIEYTNNHDSAYYQTLMTQIKSVEGYRDDMPVATIGKPEHDLTNSRQSMIGSTFDLGGKSSTNVNAYSSWNIMTRVLGFDPVLRDSDEDENEFRNNSEIKNMPNYPADGSIRVIDNTVIVKFQDFDEIGKEE